MADVKITALTVLTAADPINDAIPIVDVSNISMAASGTTSRISINNLLSSSPTATGALTVTGLVTAGSAAITGAATVGTTLGVTGVSTLASASVTGDLTVRTNQLVVNSSGVGVGTTPSAWSGIGPAIQVEQASLLSESSNQLYLTANGYFAGGQWNYINNASADQYYQIAGSHVWRNGTGGSPGTTIGWSTLMTLNSTGLGVGGGPSYKLDVTDNSTNIQARLNSSNNNGTSLQFVNTGTSGRTWQIGTGFAVTAGHFEIYDATAAVNRLSIDSSGNVGIGVSTFGTSAAKVLSIGTGTEPTTGPAGSVQFFTSTRSASNTIPAIFTEGSGVTNAAITNTTVTNKIAIKVNGTIYYLLATTSAA